MTVASALRVKVSVPDVWDVVEVTAAPDWSMRRLKRTALTLATGRTLDSDLYLVKYRGALVIDESETLGALNVADRASLIVLPTRRQPVR
ncbi:MAG: hypothetical protein OEO20_03065 [Gemmatimonadota bacterium]|nr:hypothetical protein [Gemmatimonadota bacterium]MDH3366656.1 hypothetical protein [Gemmatimonadota bacterium]MDH3477265.1 hypothetical protein [Gemmatimonadota bacterium]MDH5548640.1 hypothetical protein [Gemmatimonadota bacterium]